MVNINTNAGFVGQRINCGIFHYIPFTLADCEINNDSLRSKEFTVERRMTKTHRARVIRHK